MIPVPRNSGTNLELEGVTLCMSIITGCRYTTHFYCLESEAGFNSDVVEYFLPVDPATHAHFPAATGSNIFPL